GTDFLDQPTPALNASAAEGHDESLPQRVRVPCGPSAWLERDARTTDACRVGSPKQRVDTNRAGEPLGRPNAGGLRADSLNVHGISSCSQVENDLQAAGKKATTASRRGSDERSAVHVRILMGSSASILMAAP